MDVRQKFGGADRALSIARFSSQGGPAWLLYVSPDCERFVGRFALLPELHGSDGVIRFRGHAR